MPIILRISRLIPSKEPDVLLDALKILNNKYKLKFKAITRGEGPLRGLIQRKINRYNLADKVSFVGKIPFWHYLNYMSHHQF
uniref:Glycosyltransferase n=1 Tax=Fervidobacterium pennivorans TaxID=93466 RepID=A0A7V4CPN9_FERPE